MKTEYIKTNLKNRIAAAAVLTAIVVAILGSIVNSTDARANYLVMQKMEAIVVTAPRIEIAKLETIVVTALRETSILVASN
jgi:hypothetical protein